MNKSALILFCLFLFPASVILAEATIVPMPTPFGVHWGRQGLLLTSVDTQSVYRLELHPNLGMPRRLIGNGQKGETQNSSWQEAEMNWPHEVRVNSAGVIYIADTRNHRIVKASPEDHSFSVVCGGKMAGLNQPHSIVLLDDSTLLIADTLNHRLCKFDLNTNQLTDFGGNRKAALPTEGARVSETSLFGPRSLAVDEANIWLALREGNSIWRIDRNDLTIHRVAGTGMKGYSGDGGDPKNATFRGPKGIDVDAKGRILVVDTENHCVRRIDRTTQRIETVLGGTKAKATMALLRPHGIAANPDEIGFWVADSENHRLIYSDH